MFVIIRLKKKTGEGLLLLFLLLLILLFLFIFVNETFFFLVDDILTVNYVVSAADPVDCSNEVIRDLVYPVKSTFFLAPI